MLPTRDSLHLEGHTEAQSERIKKDTPCKCKQKIAGVAILTSE